MARKPNMARRRAIARKAFEVIKARGAHRTTMSDIAAELDIKRPTLYWYFKDFGEIFDEVVRETDAALEAFVLERLAGITHPIDMLAALVEASLDFFSGRRDHVMVLFQLWALTGESGPERMGQRSREFIEPIRRELSSRLAQGIEQGLVAPCDPDTVVEMAFALIDGAHVQRVTRDVPPRTIFEGLRTYVFEPLRLEPQGD